MLPASAAELQPQNSQCMFCCKVLPTSAGLQRHIQLTPACRAAWDVWFEQTAAQAGRNASEHDARVSTSNETPESFENVVSNSTDDNPYRARVEDVPDEDDVTQWAQKYPRLAGEILRDGECTFERWRRESRAQGRARWYPFQDAKEWELAKWLACNVGQNQTEAFFKLDIIRDDLDLSASSRYTFNKKIDQLPTTMRWTYDEVTVQGDQTSEDGQPITEVLELWRRNPIDCIRELIGNPAFRDVMKYAPEKVFEDLEARRRVVDEMWTGDWWWDIQSELPEGATVAPVILSSDKTQLSRHRGDQAAWPVYLTIGNIAKATRRKISSRAMILIGYIPTSKLGCFSEARRSVGRWNLWHHCMRRILDELVMAGREGVEMVCADGGVRRVFPIVAAYIADHPEQCLVTNVQDNFCPRGTAHANDLGSPSSCLLRNVADVLATLDQHRLGHDPAKFTDEGLRPVYTPFWADLPHCDIFACITPDILHQLHKGMFKDHLVSWCMRVVGKEEMDQRFRCVPDLPGLRRFKKGISHVSQWTGAEQKEMQKVFVPLLAGALPPKVLAVAQAVVDFTYYAQFHTHTTRSLDALCQALRRIHDNISIFQELGIRDDFNLPKLHSLLHYYEAIMQRGALDGYNTELPERLHIEFAKEAYRAGNQRDYIAHMTTWLCRQDAIEKRTAYLDWLAETELVDSPAVMDLDDARPSGRPADTTAETTDMTVQGRDAGDISENLNGADSEVHECSPGLSRLICLVSKKCPLPQTTLHDLETSNRATEFLPAFTEFVRSTYPQSLYPPSAINSFRVWRQIKIERQRTLHMQREGTHTFDRLRATASVPRRGRTRETPAHFDTCLVIEDPLQYARRPKGSLLGIRAARLKVLFALPPVFGHAEPRLLAYIEWYTPFTRRDPATNMWIVSRSTRNHRPNAAVVSTDRILGQCLLLPKCGQTIDKRWTSDNVLDVAASFYVSPYLSIDRFARGELYHSLESR